MKDLVGKLLHVHTLILFGGIIVSVCLAFLFVNQLLLPRALKTYGIEVPGVTPAQPKKAKAKPPAPPVKKEIKVKKEKVKEKVKEKAREIGPTFSLNPIVVNVADSDARRFLKTQIVLETNNEKTVLELEKRSPQVYNQLIEILSSYRVEDISDNLGKERLRGEAMDRINLFLTTGKVVNVYLNELVIQ